MVELEEQLSRLAPRPDLSDRQIDRDLYFFLRDPRSDRLHEEKESKKIPVLKSYVQSIRSIGSLLTRAFLRHLVPEADFSSSKVRQWGLSTAMLRLFGWRAFICIARLVLSSLRCSGYLFVAMILAILLDVAVHEFMRQHICSNSRNECYTHGDVRTCSGSLKWQVLGVCMIGGESLVICPSCLSSEMRVEDSYIQRPNHPGDASLLTYVKLINTIHLVEKIGYLTIDSLPDYKALS